MTPKTAGTIAARLAVIGTPTDLRQAAGDSVHSHGVCSAANKTLVDAEGILYSDSGQLEISASDKATVEMNNVPTSPPTASTILLSCWHTNTVAIKALRYASWQRAATGSVAYMTTTY